MVLLAKGQLFPFEGGLPQGLPLDPLALLLDTRYDSSFRSYGKLPDVVSFDRFGITTRYCTGA